MKRYLAVFALLVLVAGYYFSPNNSADAQNAGGWGTIVGRIVWPEGKKIPEPEKLQVNKDQAHCLGKGFLYSEDFVINDKNRGVRDVYVWLAPMGEGKLPIHPSLQSIKEKKVFIDQPRCAFVPHALGIREGQTLVAKNSAPITHNFRYSGHPSYNPGANFAMPPNTKFEIDNLKADRFPITIKCDIHSWMKASARVFDHPYFAVTDADGKFKIPNAPAGKYRLIGWHQGSGWLESKTGRVIEIQSGENKPMEISMK